MKKILFKRIALVVFLFLSYNTLITAQVDTVDLKDIKTNAEKWFKKKYVDTYFKDPYSYKLMGIKVIPVTQKEALTIQLSKVLNNIENCKAHPDERTQESQELYLSKYEENMSSIKKEQEYIESETDVEYHTKKKAVYVKYAKLYLDRAEVIATYLLDIDEKNRLEMELNRLTTEVANRLAYYDIRLDCYSKNSIGNEVLGRYSFPFTQKGPLYGDDTVKYIFNLND